MTAPPDLPRIGETPIEEPCGNRRRAKGEQRACEERRAEAHPVRNWQWASTCSWIFVDQIDLSELDAALDVKSTGKAADPYDLGTSRVPLARLKPKDEWCAIFGHYSFVLDITIGTDPPRLARLPAKLQAVSCVVLEHANISYASLWQGREIWQAHHQPSKEQHEHWNFWGDLPPSFIASWEAA